jgi:hypothetical protein
LLHRNVEFTKIKRIFAVVPDKVYNEVISMARNIAGDRMVGLEYESSAPD